MDPISLPLRVVGLMALSGFILTWWAILYPRGFRRLCRLFLGGGGPRCSCALCWRRAVGEVLRWGWESQGRYCRRHLERAVARVCRPGVYWVHVDWLAASRELPSIYRDAWSDTSALTNPAVEARRQQAARALNEWRAAQ